MTRGAGAVAVVLSVLLLSAWRKGDDRDVMVVSTSSLTNYWSVEGQPMPDDATNMEVRGLKSDAAGCVNVGFFIGEDGKAGAPRLLKEASNSRTARTDGAVDFGLLAFAPRMKDGRVVSTLQYQAAASNQRRSPVFTSYPFVYMSRILARGLDESSKQKFFEALRRSCDIDDLPAWVKSQGVSNPIRVPAPTPPSLPGSQPGR